MLSGFGIGSIFVPLSTTAVAGLPNEEIGNASGLYNLFRNVGGSIGISLVNTIVARHAQLHQNEMVHSLAASAIPRSRTNCISCSNICIRRDTDRWKRCARPMP